MGLRYSIFGFSQERVMSIRAMNGEKELRLDVTDLLLLNQIADFPNRSNVIKILEGDKMFFWMSYSEFLEELPILNLKKQALRDRFDKLVTLGLLEKMVNKTSNMTLFRLTDMYEKLKYGAMIYDTEKGCVVNYEGVYSDTQGVCSGLHTISEYNNNKIYKEKEVVCDVAPMLFSAEQAITVEYKTTATTDKDFEDMWLLYERKGSKANAKKEFAKLTEVEVETMRKHIPAYLESRPERQYRQDFERYIKHKTFNSVVYSKQNTVLYDPDANNTSATYEAPQEFSQGTKTITINGITYK